ncbi:MAG: ATP-binding protein [Anaerolineales bacterium]
MTRELESNRPAERHSPRGPLTLNIRDKIVLPYLLLTFAIATIGIYVVMNLVAGSLDERLTNHLMEAGRVVSDNLARQEIRHIEAARLIAFTQDLAEALEAGDTAEIAALAEPAAAGTGIDTLILVDSESNEMLHLLRNDNGTLRPVSTREHMANLWIIEALLTRGNESAGPLRAIGRHPIDERHYYFTAIPVRLTDELVGVTIVGTRLDEMVAEFKANALADVIIYLDGGQIVANTLTLAGEDDESLPPEMRLSSDEYVLLLYNTELTFVESAEIRGRGYRLAHGPLSVSNQTLGVFGIALPTNFILDTSTASRTTYVLLFGFATTCVIGVGILVARRITSPLARLVATSRAVAEGQLDRRTGIRSSDEIGILATTFDEMTGRLEERTQELQDLLQVYKEASGRMRAILLSIGDGVILEDLEGNLVPLNPAAETMLTKMTGSPRADFDLDGLQELADAEWELPDDDSAPWLDERRRLEVGRQVLDIHSAPVHTDEGEYLGRVIVLRDVTAEAEAERLKDAFVSHVSHELRTPLTAIKGYSSLLVAHAAEALGQQMYGFIKTIHRNANDLISMVDQLLELSEMEARGHLAVRPQPGNIGPLIHDVTERWREQMAEKDLELHVDVPEHLPQANVDLRRLRWALIALVRNAWQYTPTGGTIEVRARVVDEQLFLDVSDTGSGMGPEELDQLFTRFHRSTSLEGEEARGLGLGLYLTRAIVEAHEGAIQVTSEQGAGSTFSIVLPALNAGALAPAGSPNESAHV